MAVNGLESIIDQSLGLTNTIGSRIGASSSDTQRESAAKRDAQDISAATVTLSSRGMPRTIRNSYEKVELSSRVPQQIPVAAMSLSEEIADKMMTGDKLNRAQLRELREDRVLAALTGMRILQEKTGELEKVWLSGVPLPTDAEMQEAYRRLTQRLGNPASTEELLRQNADRVGLLEHFRSRDFSGAEGAARDEEAADKLVAA